MRDRKNPKHFRVTLLIAMDGDARKEDALSLAMDLEWVGGCRDIEDPAFRSCDVLDYTITRARVTKKGKIK